jgi:hypothetical protein
MALVFQKRRDRRRKPLIYPALIEQEGGGRPIRCHVCSESEQGAQITTAVEDAPRIPDKFILNFGAGRAGRQCEVLWRGRHVIGVKFLAETKDQATSK